MSDRFSFSFIAVLVILVSGCVSVPEPPSPTPLQDREVEREFSTPELKTEPEPGPGPDPVAPMPLPTRVAIPERALPPEVPGVFIPEPPPARAGLSPEPEQIPALVRYVRSFATRRTPYPPELDPVIRQYLGSVEADGIILRIDPWHERRTGAYYGRVDISVAPVEVFASFVPETTVHGPTVSSRISALDAELNSLFSFPLPVLREAVEHVQHETEVLLRTRGIPYVVQVTNAETITPAAAARVRAVLFSLGNPAEAGDVWWFHLPPRELARALETRIPSGTATVDVEERSRTVVIHYR